MRKSFRLKFGVLLLRAAGKNREKNRNHESPFVPPPGNIPWSQARENSGDSTFNTKPRNQVPWLTVPGRPPSLIGGLSRKRRNNSKRNLAKSHPDSKHPGAKGHRNTQTRLRREWFLSFSQGFEVLERDRLIKLDQAAVHHATSRIDLLERGIDAQVADIHHLRD